MILRYPKGVKAGQTRAEMVLNVDAAPTLLEIAGLPVPPIMQGRSFAGLAEGRAAPDWRKDWLYEYYEYPGYENVRPNRGVRTERYKFIHYFTEPQEFELYDLQADPHEDHNLYGRPETAELTTRLKLRLEALRQETQDHYVYKPSRVPLPSVVFLPPATPTHPWQPQHVDPRP
jgi:arylsulfatase A-like enzyme